MNASPRFSFASLLVLSALGLAAVTGCSSDPSAPAPAETAGNQSSSSTSTPRDPSCVGKLCGADCSPAGSDEPFNCTYAGACLATPVELDCKKCPEFLADCAKGQSPADADGDGCIDSCK